MDDLNENAETGFVVEEVNQVIKARLLKLNPKLIYLIM